MQVTIIITQLLNSKENQTDYQKKDRRHLRVSTAVFRRDTLVQPVKYSAAMNPAFKEASKLPAFPRSTYMFDQLASEHTKTQKYCTKHTFEI